MRSNTLLKVSIEGWGNRKKYLDFSEDAAQLSTRVRG